MLDFITQNDALVGTIALMVFAVVILGIGSEMFRRWLDHKERMAAALNAETAEKAAQYAAHNAKLESRVQVLERIVTDGGTELSAAIEALREPEATHRTN